MLWLLVSIECLSERWLNVLRLQFLYFVHVKSLISLILFLDTAEPRDMRLVEDIVGAQLACLVLVLLWCPCRLLFFYLFRSQI